MAVPFETSRRTNGITQKTDYQNKRTTPNHVFLPLSYEKNFFCSALIKERSLHKSHDLQSDQICLRRRAKQISRKYAMNNETGQSIRRKS
ncbi:hypothetical protein I7I53_12210 [Histoplasma capsulatum var. duboisii H88]|uniref:Uncharacterized protein n=1 Tax=Ajellomyces capsulatus (strain H88) TaxID=544711 RepID=A0A8A1M122_AJEC8|nr:hypothetical protein I7I53_12210 [Histoplasma capsulatum var. duboisii H88]